jgi:hypothetical protein
MRRPADVLRKSETRAAAWEAIRSFKGFPFKLKDIAIRCDLEQSTIRGYVRGLEAAGYLRRVVKGGIGMPASWTLVEDPGIEPPRVRDDGTAVTQGRGREQMWRSMRILKEFDARDLAAAASTEARAISVEDARNYIYYLHRAGYLVITVDAHHRGMSGFTRYRFIQARYTGPMAPMVQRVKRVFDPNVGKIVWGCGHGGDNDRE